MLEIAYTGFSILAVAGALLNPAGIPATQGTAASSGPAPPACRSKPAAAGPEPTSRRPSLLILHAGGFILPAADAIEPACTLATDAGFDVVFVRYPLGDIPEAVAASERVARREGRDGVPVFAYGESAGGTLAALLAQKGLVEASATYSPLTDLVAYYSRTPDPARFKFAVGAANDDLRAYSPGLHDAGNPILAMVPNGDDPALNRETESWDRRDSSVETVAVQGPHIGTGDPETYERNVSKALGWLKGQG